MLPRGIESALQSLYHNTVVAPFRTNLFYNLSRMDHLQWKSKFDSRIHIVGHDKNFRAISEHGGLSVRERLELINLKVRWGLKERLGNEPFGTYPYFHLTRETDGTKDKPFSLVEGSEVQDALPGLILLARVREGGVYFRAGPRGYNPPIHLSQNFELTFMDHSPSNAFLHRLKADLLEHDHLMKRKSRTGFMSTINWYNRNASTYARSIQNVVSHKQVEAFSRLLPENGNILDEGCGGGRDVEVFRKLGFKTSGLDLSEGLLSVARQRNPDSPLVRADILASPFRNDSFDGLWVHASMHHLEKRKDVDRGFREFRRLLRRGGILHFATQAKTGKDETALVVDSLAGQARFYRYMTKGQVERGLQKAGFRVLDLQQHRETDEKVSSGRKSVEWIIALAEKK